MVQSMLDKLIENVVAFWKTGFFIDRHEPKYDRILDPVLKSTGAWSFYHYKYLRAWSEYILVFTPEDLNEKPVHVWCVGNTNWGNGKCFYHESNGNPSWNRLHGRARRTSIVKINKIRDMLASMKDGSIVYQIDGEV